MECGDFGMCMENEERELYDFVGPVGSQELQSYGLYENGDVFGDGVICRGFGLIWE